MKLIIALFSILITSSLMGSSAQVRPHHPSTYGYTRYNNYGYNDRAYHDYYTDPDPNYSNPSTPNNPSTSPPAPSVQVQPPQVPQNQPSTPTYGQMRFRQSHGDWQIREGYQGEKHRPPGSPSGYAAQSRADVK